jgi:hypothetical protein
MLRTFQHAVAVLAVCGFLFFAGAATGLPVTVTAFAAALVAVGVSSLLVARRAWA